MVICMCHLRPISRVTRLSWDSVGVLEICKICYCQLHSVSAPDDFYDVPFCKDDLWGCVGRHAGGTSKGARAGGGEHGVVDA